MFKPYIVSIYNWGRRVTTVNYTNVYAIRNIDKAARQVTPLHLGVVSTNKNIVMVAVICGLALPEPDKPFNNTTGTNEV